MKKLLLGFCSIFFLSFLSMAQITITNSNPPTAGNVLTEREDTLHAGVSIGNAGANQTWNFSGLVNHKVTQTGFVVPSSLPGVSNFPSANLGMTDGGSVSQFANISSSAFDLLGMYGDVFGIGSEVAMEISPSLKMITFPSTYNTSYNGNFLIDEKFPYTIPGYPVDSARMSRSTAYTSTIDAYGTITTPSFSGESVLRQNYREITTSTVYVHMTAPAPQWVQNGSPTVDTTYSYRFWGNSSGFQTTLIEIGVKKSISNTDSVTSAKWFHSYAPGTVTGLTENTTAKKEVAVYPNPANNVINISGISEISAVIISDITGKVVTGSILDKTKNTINVSGFDNGIYIYQITDTKGNVSARGRFTVTK